VLLLSLATNVSAQRGGHGRGYGGVPGREIELPGGLPKLRTHHDAVERWNQMSPEERERALEKLPPDRRKDFQDRLDRFNKLPQSEQQQLRERYQQFLQLPLAKQDQVRKEIKQFNQLPDDRRQALSKEFEQLRSLPEADRKTKLESDEYKSKFSPDERRMLRDLSSTLGAPAKEPPSK
jgi:hypothetical protein